MLLNVSKVLVRPVFVNKKNGRTPTGTQAHPPKKAFSIDRHGVAW
jgi:hypothetical protein